MKTIRISILPLFIFLITASCQKENFGEPVLTPSKTTVAVDEEVTITLSGVFAPGHGQYSSCNKWSKVSGPNYTAVSGGADTDNKWTVKFTATGTAVIQCDAAFCSHTGNTKSKTAQTTITVQ
jgi:hypothetical protein